MINSAGCGAALSLFALLVAPAFAADWPVGAPIDNAAAIDVTPEGFDAVAAVIPAFLPSSIDVPAVSGDGGECWLVGGYTYYYALSGAWAGIQVVSADITPGNGVLDVTADLLVTVNNSTSPFALDYEAACGVIGDTCPGYITPFNVHIDTTIGLAVTPDAYGVPHLDATVGAINLTYDVSGDNFQLDCTTADVIGFFRDYLGLDLYDYVLGLVSDQLNSTVADLGPTIESTLEDAFAQATISQDLDLNGASAHLDLYPSDVDISPAGLRITMAGDSYASAQAECIAAFDPGSSLATPSAAPDIGSAPSGVDTPYHLGLNLSDDFTNQLMYSLWRGGLLCYSLAPGGAFTLDTSILNLLTGDAFTDVFPESQPVILSTLPRGVPTVDYAGGHDIDVDLHDLDLEFYAELDGRQARVLSVSLSGPVGADLDLDGATGNLGIVLDINADNLTPEVVYNELHADANDAILDSFGSTLSGLMDTVLSGFIGDLAFALPSFSGLGLQELQVSAAGSNEDWLGAYARVGPVTYGSADGGCGCGSDGSSSGCSSGCSTDGGVDPAALGAIPLALALIMRRKR